ncbi:hypothetical protein Sru01_12550 [Sphaerisporangium rufum]|uniref:Uncharacterized protein n=1 Tax=Sphaerisporangium rufum TaxID=1381558 RepID=A0A919V041_9ACTN|nr:hypothetical protein [Sphaerisporangium rufum]GII76273.1 hypothetical protein Sru01_12550 [Sphaerisporangium rufum]
MSAGRFGRAAGTTWDDLRALPEVWSEVREIVVSWEESQADERRDP